MLSGTTSIVYAFQLTLDNLISDFMNHIWVLLVVHTLVLLLATLYLLQHTRVQETATLAMSTA